MAKKSKRKEWHFEDWKPDWKNAEKHWQEFKENLQSKSKQMEDALKNRNLKNAIDALDYLMILRFAECDLTPPL